MPPLHLPFLSSATITLWVLSSSSAHIPTPLACLLCVCVPCGLCSVGLSADISISHMFITAATRTRCVPPPPSPLPVLSGNSVDFSPSLRSLAARFPPPPWLVCGSALLKHECLLVAVFVHFPGALLIVRLPLLPHLLCALPTTNHLTSFLLPDNPPALAAFGGGRGAGQGIGWGRTP